MGCANDCEYEYECVGGGARRMECGRGSAGGKKEATRPIAGAAYIHSLILRRHLLGYTLHTIIY